MNGNKKIASPKRDFKNCIIGFVIAYIFDSLLRKNKKNDLIRKFTAANLNNNNEVACYMLNYKDGGILSRSTPV